MQVDWADDDTAIEGRAPRDLFARAIAEVVARRVNGD
jgi:putative intracellular protease/amidase